MEKAFQTPVELNGRSLEDLREALKGALFECFVTVDPGNTQGSAFVNARIPIPTEVWEALSISGFVGRSAAPRDRTLEP